LREIFTKITPHPNPPQRGGKSGQMNIITNKKIPNFPLLWRGLKGGETANNNLITTIVL